MDTCHKSRLDQLTAPRRNRYFYGKLLDELHLTMEQEYFNGKRWLLNRLALGSGVLCGLEVKPDGKYVWISAGVAIDAYGREIIVPTKVRIDPSKIAANCDTVRDRDTAKESQVYLALCFRECKADLEPALVTDCQSNEQCEASTIIEGYCVQVHAEPLPTGATHNDALCDALKGGKDAAEKRKKITEVLTQACSQVTGDACVVLATIQLATDGTVTSIDASTLRSQVVSNEVLFDMLLCQQSGGQGSKGDTGSQGPIGPQGPIGLGLEPDLPKIRDIAWEHKKLYRAFEKADFSTVGDFLAPFWDEGTAAFATADVLAARILSGDTPPLFTVYFNRVLKGIDTETFTVHLKFELMTTSNNTWTRPGIAIELPLTGQILTVTGNSKSKTPHTGEPFAFAASFVPRPEFFSSVLMLVLYLAYAEHLAAQDDKTRGFVTFRIGIKGDFLTTTDAEHFEENQVLDADNIGGLVGLNRQRKPPIKDGKNPSGNLTQGGDFESWLRVALLAQVGTATGSKIAGAHVSAWANMAANIPANAASLPVAINLANARQLEAVGLSHAQSAKIIAARKIEPFAHAADFAKRSKLPAQMLSSIEKKIILL